MILVLPDSFTKYSGSMYSNSLTTGDWEGYVSSDLITYIDSHYRTIANRDGRGLAGHSMGGYGTVRIGMKQPAVFSLLYAMSSCCLMNNPAQGRGAAPPNQPATPANGATPPQAAARGARGGGLANALSAQAAAWRPIQRILRNISICPPRTASFNRSWRRSGSQTRHSSWWINMSQA